MPLLDKVIDFRHELHANPEPSMRETETRVRIKQFLQENTTNLKIVEKIAGCMLCMMRDQKKRISFELTLMRS